MNIDELENHYKILEYKLLTGKDKINRLKFSEEKDINFSIIIKKYNNETYKFTNYKQIITKANRTVNIPTIRDRILLDIIKDKLQNKYLIKYKNRHKEIEHLIDILKDDMPLTIIKLDIKNFFDSINKPLLFSKLKNNNLLESRDYIVLYKSLKQFHCGVGQGLPISNSLAEIYLENIDWTLKRLSQNVIFYSRFVDDIIIVLNGYSSENELKKFKEEIHSLFDKYKLNLNHNKSSLGNLSNNFSFDYLGYKFSREEMLNSKNNYSQKLNIGITQKKFNKECKKIIKTFKDYEDNNNYRLLEERLSILTRKNYIYKSHSQISNGIIEDSNRIICFGFIDNYKYINTDTYFKNLDKLIAKNLYKYINNKNQRRLLFKYSYYNNFKKGNYNNFINFSTRDFINRMLFFPELFPFDTANAFGSYELLELQRYYFSQILKIYNDC